tara:strand:+ start:288 stop:446 length:159 start_codon:yes stop_codon:yes gene_type:complete
MKINITVLSWAHDETNNACHVQISNSSLMVFDTCRRPVLILGVLNPEVKLKQ